MKNYEKVVLIGRMIRDLGYNYLMLLESIATLSDRDIDKLSDLMLTVYMTVEEFKQKVR